MLSQSFRANIKLRANNLVDMTTFPLLFNGGKCRFSNEPQKLPLVWILGMLFPLLLLLRPEINYFRNSANHVVEEDICRALTRNDFLL
jgi:hypothetical protein